MHIHRHERIVLVDVGNDFAPQFGSGEFVRFVGERERATRVVCKFVRNACGALDFKFAVPFDVVRFATESGVVCKAFFAFVYTAVFVLNNARAVVYVIDST